MKVSDGCTLWNVDQEIKTGFTVPRFLGKDQLDNSNDRQYTAVLVVKNMSFGIIVILAAKANINCMFHSLKVSCFADAFNGPIVE